MAGEERLGSANGVLAAGNQREETRTADGGVDAEGGSGGGGGSRAAMAAGDGLALPSSGLAPGTRVGRYELVELIGRGGSGVVYRAHDPRLSRAVALKFLASADGSVSATMQDRLLQEAQILARLSHPNIVAAYDIGNHAGVVYIVMELIDGAPLSEWLRQGRSRAELLGVLIAAGRGLAAAHAAGVVHRDFKPANVMVSRDGGVRVVDFGLARSGPAERMSAPMAGASDAGLNGSELAPGWAGAGATLGPTRSSAWSGTPGYIAPEQLRGQAADSRSDQFSYAVTAFVALVGSKPYPDSFAADLSAPERAAAPAWPASIPRRLRHIIDRGLAVRADDRYPSLAALVADLERAASPLRRKRIALGLAAAACASLAVSGVVSRDDGARAMCSIDDSELGDVWGSARRAAVEQAFRATGRSNAGEVFQLVSRRLAAFEAQWLAIRRESCEATHVRGEQPERVMALRAGCLHRAREAAKTLVAALTEVDAAMLDTAAGSLPPSLAACAEPDMNEPDAGPMEPALRAKVDEVELGIAVTGALTSAGRGPQAIERATRTLELARSTGHARTMAAAAARFGRASLAAARTVEEKAAAEVLLKEAIQSAAAAGDEALAARTSTYLFVNVAYAQRRIQEAEAMLPAVEAVVTLAGNAPEQRTELLMGKAAILTEHMQLAESIETLDEVIRLAPSVDSEVRQYGINASTQQAIIYSELGNHEAAIAAQRRALDALRAAYGTSHPRILVGLVNLARMLSRAKQREPALEALAELRRLAATMPPSEPRLENLPQIEGEVWQNLGDCGRAIPFLRAALERFSASYGADHPRTTDVLTPLGTCLAEQRQTAEAIAHLERALESRRSRGETPSSIGFQAFDLAKVLWLLPSRRARAVALVNEAKALWKQDGATASQIEEWLGEHEAAR
jgi:tetratricopeptide (TPR) repeat protein/predicted Ser/Thr protein kinase